MRIPPGVLWVDPAPDGAIEAEDAGRESLVLLVNFFEQLRRREGRVRSP
jgi:hypothetical protein